MREQLSISIWGQEIPIEVLSKSDLDYLEKLPSDIPSVEWIWSEMDRIWDIYLLDNKRSLNQQRISDFYRHPVWIANGIFTSADRVSQRHRKEISKYIVHNCGPLIADFGGGFGELSRAIISSSSVHKVDIIEPYPSELGIFRVKDHRQICFSSKLNFNYDVVVAQDVLEHVEDPLSLAFDLAKATRIGGCLIFANCFYPVIKCHLPATFHYRYTFRYVMRALGLRYMGRISGADHALVFERVGSINISFARKAEFISKKLGPQLNSTRSFLSKLKSRSFS